MTSQPSFVFVIDVSASAVSMGVIPVVCDTIRSVLDTLPGETRTQVGAHVSARVLDGRAHG
jgi:protein transport protein SEC24